LERHLISGTAQLGVLGKGLEQHRLAQGNGAVLIRVREATPRHVGAAGRERRCRPVPPHAAVDVVVAFMALVTLKPKVLRQVGASTTGGDGTKASKGDIGVIARRVIRVGGMSLAWAESVTPVDDVAHRPVRSDAGCGLGGVRPFRK
jgi:hypothetical protein